MNRVFGYALGAIPVVMVLAGIYIMVATPDVITYYQEYSSSHSYGIGLVLLGGVGGLIAALVKYA